MDAGSVTLSNLKEPSHADAIIPKVALFVLIARVVFSFGLDALDGPVQVALILSTMVVALILLKNGYPWDGIVRAGRAALSSITTPIFILLVIAALIGTWNMFGTIPTMVYYGIPLLHPAYLHAAALVICTTVSLVVGSSWATVGTIGVGLMGLSTMVGVSPTVTAGAVISGSADAGTVTSPPVPWNSGGAYMAATPGVPTMLYLPFCIFNIAVPSVSLFLGFTGFKIEHVKPADARAPAASR